MVNQVIHVALYAVLPAFAVAAAVLALARAVGKGRAAPAADAALALAAGVAVGYLLNADVAPLWPPKLEETGWEWLPAATFLALAVGLIVRLPKVPMGVTWLLRAL